MLKFMHDMSGYPRVSLSFDDDRLRTAGDMPLELCRERCCTGLPVMVLTGHATLSSAGHFTHTASRKMSS